MRADTYMSAYIVYLERSLSLSHFLFNIIIVVFFFFFFAPKICLKLLERELIVLERVGGAQALRHCQPRNDRDFMGVHQRV